MACLVPQFKCPSSDAHFRHSLQPFHTKARDYVCFRSHCLLSPTAAVIDIERLPTLEVHSTSLDVSRPFNYAGAVGPPLKTNLEATLDREAFLTSEEALIAAAAAEAVALARAAVEFARNAAQMIDNSVSIKSEKTGRFPSEADILRIERARLTEREWIGLTDSPDSAESNPLEDNFAEYLSEETGNLSLKEDDDEAKAMHDSDSTAIRSGRQTERKARRARATEKASAGVIHVKSLSSSKRRRSTLQEIDYSDPLRYLRGTTSTSKLLTASEELELSEGIQDKLKLERLQEELAERNGGQPTFAQWAAAAGVDQRTLRKRLNHGTLCKDKMIKSNIRLVISIAKNYQGAGMNLQDLVQEGCRGLVKGAEKFDATKGFKFSTYAHWWIKQAVRKSLSEQSRTIRLPFHMVEATYRVREAKKQLYSENGRHPDHEEVAEAAGLTMKRLEAVMLTPKAPRSLDQKIGINQSLKPSEVIADPDAKTSERNNGELFNDDIRELAPNGVNDFSVGSPLGSSERRLTTSSLQKNISFEHSVYSEKSDATNMHSKATSLDGIRTSISSIPSTSSHGSTQDDFDASGDVYVWGEVISDNSSRVSADRSSIPSGTKTDILLPKPLESNVVLDIQQVACGVRHSAILTRQGEVFTWGEEAGGRLGHGVGSDIVHPRLLESLSALNVDYVACGEFHTCAVTVLGELYTWGDGTHNAGLLGHGSSASHWMPKRVAGPLDGLQVSFVSCGVWHTALITTTGQLFTFGDGTFGVLGHGNRETILYPREVESVSGLRTIAVSCGVWHTAAVVEVIVTQSSTSSGKLFTWGDGDKYRLGHVDKEPRLKPTCVASLIDYNFHKVACGHSLTIGLTTSGQVFTMGSTVYGQLGNPRFDGKVPCPVEDKLMNESVSEVSCGSYHVAVLTVRGEVYTWGKGANGRLGHGDLEDRKMPTLVEALKDRPVKRISCGSSFTAAICQHKWVSGAEQTQCSACRQTFGFTRKRHNCYNCGLVHCHQCSSRKALRAALAPNPGKPYRVCDSCFVKLSNSLESGGSSNRKYAKPRLSNESKDKFDKYDTSSVKSSMSSNLDLIKNLDIKAAKTGKNSIYLTMARTPQPPPVLQLRNIAFPGGADMNQVVSRTVLTLAEKPKIRSRALSPFSRKPSPPRSTTPTPTMSGLSFSASISESLKKTNDLLSQELLRLRAEVDTLRQRCDRQELEMQKSERKAQEAIALAAEESAKSKAAKEVIKSLTAQLKDMAARFPTQLFEDHSERFLQASNGLDLHSEQSDMSSRLLLGNATASNMDTNIQTFPAAHGNGLSNQHVSGVQTIQTNDTSVVNHVNLSSNAVEEDSQNELRNDGDAADWSSPRKADLEARRAAFQNHDYDSMPRSPNSASNQIEAEWIEQFEPGVYITLIALRDGTRDLKRVRFSRRRFGEQQAEAWWSENRDRVYQKYNFRSSGRNSSSAST